ncbi:MAG: hypothetical protein ACYDHM_12725 [Acidiferrobacterales bacterium]
METFIDLLITRGRTGEPRIDQRLDDALLRLGTMLEALASELQVEYFGPEVGLGAGAHVYRIVVRYHESEVGRRAWSVRVCTALPHAGWRAEWTLEGASRLRKRIIVRRLPDFFDGYARAILEAGKARTHAGMRVLDLAQQFRSGSCCE